MSIGSVAFADDNARTTQKQLTWELRRLDDQTVYSGDGLYYQVGVQCSSGSGTCQDTTVRLAAPVGAAGHGVLDGALPSDGSVTISYDGNDVILHYNGQASTAVAGTTRYFNVWWPSANGTTVSGEQTVTMTVTTDGEAAPWSDRPTATIPLIADSTLSVDKWTQTTKAYYDEEFRYFIRASVKGLDTASNGHGVLNMTSVTVTDPLPAGAIFVRCENTSRCAYDTPTRTLTWTGPNLGASPLQAYQDFVVVVIFPSDGDDSAAHTVAPTDTAITNTATITGTQSGTGTKQTDSDTAGISIGKDVPVTKPPTFSKTAQDNGAAYQDESRYSWVVTAINAGSVSASARIVDRMPAGFNTLGVHTAVCRANATVTFTFTDGATTTMPLTCTTPGTIAQVSIPTGDLTAHGRVTIIDIFVPKLKPAEEASFSLITAVHVADFGDETHKTIQNCATATAAGPDGVTASTDKCANAVITEYPPPGLRVTKTTENKAWNPGDTFGWEISFANTLDNGSVLRPDLYDLVPANLDYVPGSLTLVPEKSQSFCPTGAQFTEKITNNWQAAGSNKKVTKVNWLADDDVAIPYKQIWTAPYNTCFYSIQTTVKPGTAPGLYSGEMANYGAYAGNAVYLTDAEFQPRVPDSWQPQDSLDVNENGQTAGEVMASHGAAFQVSTKAQLWVDKRVSGDQNVTESGRSWLDSAEKTGMSDQVGRSTVGGDVSYQVRLGNFGNEPLTNVVAYDLLPNPDNAGVTAARYEQDPPGLGNEWVPTMTGPIDTSGLPAAVADQLAITYSTKADPCRPEMDNTKVAVAQVSCDGTVDASFVAAGQVSDWSAIKSIRFDFGDHRFEGGENYAFTWTMDAPTTTADGGAIVGGERTWNKVAVQGAQIKEDGTLSPLLAAEYPWVVDEMFVDQRQVETDPAITIKKWSTNDGSIAAGDYNDRAKRLEPGTPEAITFTVTNTGDEALRQVVVSDRTTIGEVSIADLSCDFSSLGGPASGTSWADGPFEPNASFTCAGTLPGLAHGALHSDTASVSGIGIESGKTVRGDDPWNAYTPISEPQTPAIDIRKWSTNEGMGAGDYDNEPGKGLVAGQDESITLTITNTGTETLTNLVVQDRTTSGSGTLRDLSCDFSALGGPASGTTWPQAQFEPGGSFTCTGVLPGLEPGATHADTASVQAIGVTSGKPVDSDNPWHGFVPKEAKPTPGPTDPPTPTTAPSPGPASVATESSLAKTGAEIGVALLAMIALIGAGIALRWRWRQQG